MEKRSRDARVLRTRALLRAALVTLLGRHAVADVTVQMIVAEAGVGYATFFRHHASVEALLLDTADALIAEFVSAAMPALIARDRRTLLDHLAAFVEDHAVVVRALLLGGGETVRSVLTSRAVAATAQLPLGFDPAVPPGLAVIHAVTSAMNAVAWWLNDGTDPAGLPPLVERLALVPLDPERRALSD